MTYRDFIFHTSHNISNLDLFSAALQKVTTAAGRLAKKALATRRVVAKQKAKFLDTPFRRRVSISSCGAK